MSSVSVVIPCYRYGHYLADCVGSALDGQDGVDVRVLIIDDASPDDSADAARALEALVPADVLFIPMRAGKRDLAAFVDAKDGRLLRITTLQPWDM